MYNGTEAAPKQGNFLAPQSAFTVSCSLQLSFHLLSAFCFAFFAGLSDCMAAKDKPASIFVFKKMLKYMTVKLKVRLLTFLQ